MRGKMTQGGRGKLLFTGKEVFPFPPAPPVPFQEKRSTFFIPVLFSDGVMFFSDTFVTHFPGMLLYSHNKKAPTQNEPMQYSHNKKAPTQNEPMLFSDVVKNELMQYSHNKKATLPPVGRSISRIGSGSQIRTVDLRIMIPTL